MNERKTRKSMQWSVLIRARLSSGLLCCLLLMMAYLSLVYFPEFYADTLSSSVHLLMWLTLFVGALLWTFREQNSRMLPSEVTDWQCIAAFLLFTSNKVYVLLPKEFYAEVSPVISTYFLPILFVGGLVIAGLIKWGVSLYRSLENEREQRTLQMRRLQALIASPPAQETGILLVRRLVENKSISQFTINEYTELVEGCSVIDPELFAWLKKQNVQLSSRDIVLCVLVRMCKTREEIGAILGINDGSYRTMKSRARKRLGIGECDLEAFLRNL